MANRRSSFDSFGLRGQWWLPENPEEVLSGTLSYMPEDGIRLHLTGKFSGEKELTFDHRAQAILGTTNEGPATIVDAILESGQGPGFPPGRTAVERTYFCTRLLLGERFPKPEALIFDRALVTFANFEELLDYRPVEHKAGAEKDAYEDIYVVRRREDKFYHIPELDSTVTLYGELPGFSFPSYREVILRSRVVMEFKPGRPQPLKFFDKAIFQTANFLSLLIGVPVYRLTYTIPEVQEDDKVVRETVQVVTDIGRSKPPEPLHWHRFWHGLKDKVPPAFEELHRAWFRFLQWGEDPANLFLGTERNSSMFLEARFLLYLQSLESFHRGKLGGTYMAEAEYETVKDGLVRAIPEGVAEDHRDALRSRIRYGNQFSLRRRLTELLTRIPPVAMDVIAPDPGKFVSDLVESRNYYTHYDDQGKHLSWDELIAIMPHVRALIAVLFLQELGANPIKIAEVARQIVRG